MQSIRIIVCFLGGAWPRYGDLFLDSCRYNPTVDFLLLTDGRPVLPAAENIELVDFDLARFNARASERLGLEVEIHKPYKLVDLKPAWGVIFQEDLEGYDFWGYCDLDQVFGDIRAFITDELLDDYDVLGARKEFPTGHFTLFRNEEAVNRLYERSRDYRKVFTSGAVFSFDECGRGLHSSLLRGADFADVAARAEVDSLMHVLARSPDVRAHLQTMCEEQLGRRTGLAWDVLRIRWERGKVEDLLAGRALMYFHFHHLKESGPLFYIPRWKRMPDAYLITRRGVFWLGPQGWGQRLATAILRRLSYARGLLRLNVLYLASRLRRVLRR